MSFISYAQNYEDVMLARALRGIEQGFYIDVGAQDPVDDSVTKAFYDRGWRGINIEPVTHWFERMAAARPHDINLQLAVSDSPGNLHLFEVVDSGLSTTDPGLADRHARAGHPIRESDVPCVTLDSICENHPVTDIHFLKIDCEGAEAAALRGIGLDHVRPWIILLEATEPNSQKPAYADWEPLLTGRGYHFTYEDGLNRFYVANEHRELDEAFSHPPNVFDYFVRASETQVREELVVALQDLSSMRNVERLARAESESKALRNQVAYLRNENDRREAALAMYRTRLEDLVARESCMAVEAHRLHEQATAREVTLAEDSKNLNTEVGRLHYEVARRDREVARLRGLIQTIYRSTSWRASAPLRLIRRVGYQPVRLLARAARPLLRQVAAWRFVRGAGVRVLGSDSRFVRHVRLFLFGANNPGSGEELLQPVERLHPVAPLGAQARRLLEEINDARTTGVNNVSSSTTREA